MVYNIYFIPKHRILQVKVCKNFNAFYKKNLSADLEIMKYSHKRNTFYINFC